MLFLPSFFTQTLMSEYSGFMCPWDFGGLAAHLLTDDARWLMLLQIPSTATHKGASRTMPIFRLAPWHVLRLPCIPEGTTGGWDTSVNITGEPSPMREQATGYLDQSINEAASVTGPIKNSEDPFSHHSGKAQTMTSDSDARNKGLSSWHPRIKQLPHKKASYKAGNEKACGWQNVLISVSWLYITSDF